MSSINDIPTPSAVIDLDRLEGNTAKMSRRAHQLGVQLRPHVKTHKTIQAVKYQVRDHFGGITVSTLAEAEFYGAQGVHDITYAVPITPSKITRAIKISRQIDQFTVLIDNEEAVSALSHQCALDQEQLSVIIKVDCGYGRAGLTVDDPKLIVLAQMIAHDPWLTFTGVLTHAGHSLSIPNKKKNLPPSASLCPAR